MQANKQTDKRIAILPEVLFVGGVHEDIQTFEEQVAEHLLLQSYASKRDLSLRMREEG